MEWLKQILGEELYKQFETAINAHNGNEANKDKQIKIANLGGGEYVSKAKHDALQALFDGKSTELETANNLITELKKGTKGNEELQGKVTAYETQVTKLQEQLKKTQIDGEVKIALLAAKANPDDIDYLIYKLNGNGGDPLELGDDGKIKGIDDMISGLKTQHPNQFQKATGTVIDENRLPGSNTGGGMTKAEFLKKPYGERAKYAYENPEEYQELMNQ